jgi:hypothetical protein
MLGEQRTGKVTTDEHDDRTYERTAIIVTRIQRLETGGRYGHHTHRCMKLKPIFVLILADS